MDPRVPFSSYTAGPEDDTGGAGEQFLHSALRSTGLYGMKYEKEACQIDLLLRTTGKTGKYNWEVSKCQIRDASI